MPVLIWSILLAAATFGAHLAWWRVRIPRRQTRALLLLSFGCLAAGLVFLKAVGPSSSCSVWFPSSPAALFQIALFHVAMTLAYITTYSALEVDSPSLVIVLRVAQAGAQGVSREELLAELDDDALVRPRLRDLIRDGMAVLDETRYTITPKGRRFAAVFILYRRVLGLGKGG